MLQEASSSSSASQAAAVPTSGAPLPTLGGNANAHALQQAGFDQLIHNFDWLGWLVFQ